VLESDPLGVSPATVTRAAPQYWGGRRDERVAGHATGRRPLWAVLSRPAADLLV